MIPASKLTFGVGNNDNVVRLNITTMTKKVIDGTTHLYDEFAGWSFHAVIGKETTEFVVSNGSSLSVIVNKYSSKSEVWKDSRVFICNGDYFESLNPSGKAQKAWNNFKNMCYECN